MKLPNGDRAIVDSRKLTGYCLNSHHLRGRHKARVFASFGILDSDAEHLRIALLQAASTVDARPSFADAYGQRYLIDFELSRSGRTAQIRSTWIVRTGEDFARLTSCYVL